MKPNFAALWREAAIIGTTAVLAAGCVLCPARPGRYGPIDQYTLADDAVHVAADLREHPNDINYRDDAGRTPLHLAAERCRMAVIPILLAHGANPNIRAKGGTTPLHLAAQEGCAKAVELLLQAHADINARDDQGRTALRRAEQWHQDAIVRLLAMRGAIH